jgi:hypothetical protein
MIRMITSRRTRLVAGMGAKECMYGFGGKARRKEPLGRPSVDGSIMVT